MVRLDNCYHVMDGHGPKPAINRLVIAILAHAGNIST